MVVLSIPVERVPTRADSPGGDSPPPTKVAKVGTA